ncbi:MAG: nucleotidyl transferase AbiEii/AbiGii toxin family protein [Actinomycetota bacterium]
MTEKHDDARIIEFFHLAFLQVLPLRLDQARYVVKGGVNLRYFFESLRYSQDVDLDAVAIESWALGSKVDEVLASPAISLLLRSRGIVVEQVSKPKQTETTQRWKVLIAVTGRRVPVRTKIEFSHPSADPRRILEAVPDRVVDPYGLRPPTMFHYTAGAALEQKVRALVGRSQTQARDVFDLELLLRTHRDDISVELMDEGILEVAVERIFELPVDAFRDQVLPFLEPDIAALYDDPAAWEQMRRSVAQRLTEIG